MFVLYLILCVIAAFFSWRRWGDKMLEKAEDDYKYHVWADTIEFWLILSVTFLYFIVVPILLFWKLLEFLEKKFIDN